MSVHANCDHAATKTARAACRRASKNFPGVAPKPVTVADVKVETPAAPYTWDRTQNQGRFGEGDEWQSLGGVPVTRESHKEYRDLVMEITIQTYGVYGDNVVNGKITAWGEKRFTYLSPAGVSNTVATERVKAVYVA